MENKIYKVYQVVDVFVSKYNFTQTVLQAYQNYSSQESWLVNENDSNYQVIRISLTSAAQNTDDVHIKDYLEYFRCTIKEDFKFLDIHISKDKYDKSYQNCDYINLEENYADGVDVSSIYPDIYSAIHHVDDPDKEVGRIINRMIEDIRSKLKKTPFLKRNRYLITYIVMGICAFIYLLSLLLKFKYDDTSAIFVLLGADYKTFNLGLHQYFRFITYAFVHNDIIHLTCNLISIYSIGRFVEYRFGHLKYSIILLFSIIIGGLTQGILSENSICLGLSGGIYGLLVIFIIETVKTRIINIRSLIPTIIINLFLNFLSNTAWMAHLGGAIGGFAIYYCLMENSKIPMPRIALCLLILLCLFYKYVTIDSIKSIYAGTDFNIVEMYNDLGFKEYSQKLLLRLLDVYTKYGG